MKYEAILKVKREEAEQYSRLCNEPDASNLKDQVIYDEEVTFANGMRMAIQVISPTEPAKESCWVQGILLDSGGFENGCTEVGESFLGKYEVADEEDTYCVTVIGEQDVQSS